MIIIDGIMPLVVNNI